MEPYAKLTGTMGIAQNETPFAQRAKKKPGTPRGSAGLGCFSYCALDPRLYFAYLALYPRPSTQAAIAR
jgi:hypothetical protein